MTISITFIAPDGTSSVVTANNGDSIMQVAVVNNIDGIIGECGGSMMCATCHCYVGDDWTGKVGGPGSGEAELLECAASEVKPSSRLACQIKVSPELDGLVIHLPEAQI